MQLVVHLVGDSEPAEAVGDLVLLRGIGLPQCGIFGPDAPGELLAVGAAQRLVRLRLEGAERGPLPAGEIRCRAGGCASDPGGLQLGAQAIRLFFGALDQLVIGIGEELDALELELVRHVGHPDAHRLQPAHNVLRDGDVFSVERAPRLAMILEGDDGLRRHGVHRLGADQLLGVEHVTIGRIFGAGAGPEAALGRRALRAQRGEALAAEDALVGVVGQARVGDGRLAVQRAQLLLPRRILCRPELFVQQLVHQRIHATDEEAGD